ncbi:hypothetical protein [Serratia liquefaciens]|uniref:hypothetical protein n=1 Tax=Serratia liquefaciens TaxID=614 RepID=UPI0021B7DF89|nr:hypothetical protein [Serratia liquefaciens]
MARELLANREAQPIYQIWDDGHWYDAEEHVWRETYDECCESQYRIVYTAPPAPAVPDKPRLPPHVYRDLLDMLQEAAIAYGGTQQLRAQLSSALSIHVQPDHPHTREPMLAAAPEGGK